jgi:ribosome maturation factor RimP
MPWIDREQGFDIEDCESSSRAVRSNNNVFDRRRVL